MIISSNHVTVRALVDVSLSEWITPHQITYWQSWKDPTCRFSTKVCHLFSLLKPLWCWVCWELELLPSLHTFSRTKMQLLSLMFPSLPVFASGGWGVSGVASAFELVGPKLSPQLCSRQRQLNVVVHYRENGV